jgi:hypothetical protein
MRWQLRSWASKLLSKHIRYMVDSELVSQEIELGIVVFAAPTGILFEVASTFIKLCYHLIMVFKIE